MNPTEKLSYRLFLEKIFYGIKDIIKKDNKVISSIKLLNKDDEINITLKDGEIISKIIKAGE